MSTNPSFELAALLFDLDGTLLDTAPDLAAACNTVRSARGLKPLAYEHIRPWVSAGASAIAKIGSGAAEGHPDFDSFRTQFLEAYFQSPAALTQLFSGMNEVIAWLDTNTIPGGVVTNKPAKFTDVILHQLNLTNRSHCVVSGDTAAHPKPHPAPLLLAAERLSVDARRCIYVGDDKRDIEAGKQAGMFTMAATYGYLNVNDDASSWGADHYINHPSELLQWLEDSLDI